MKIKIILCLALVATLISCSKDFLQKDDPNNISDQLFYKNEIDATYGLYGVYDALQANNLYGIYFNNFDEITDNGSTGTSTNGFREFETSTQTPLNSRVRTFYTDFFNVINRANYVIKRTTEMSEGAISVAARKRIIAEASFLRDFAYFELTNLYRDVPLYTEWQSALSVGKPTTKKADIYTFIKQDLLKVLPDLPVTIPAGENGRFGQGAVLAILGKIYLYDKDYANASTTLAKLLSSPYSYNLYPNYAELFTPLAAAEFSSENIFYINFAGDGVDNGSGFSNTININLQPSKPRPDFAPSANLVDSYLCADGLPIANSALYGPKSPTYNATGINRFLNRDPRLRATILTSADVLPNGQKLWSFTSNTAFAKKKYVEVTTTQYANGPQNFYIIRFADVLLMYAEAMNEITPVPDLPIYDAVNKIRRRVAMPDYPLGLTQAQMRQMIRDERRWEFALEYQRYFDLKRWGILKETVLASGMSLKAFTDPRDYVWPLPQTEIDNNPNISQAAEWK